MIVSRCSIVCRDHVANAVRAPSTALATSAAVAARPCHTSTLSAGLTDENSAPSPACHWPLIKFVFMFGVLFAMNGRKANRVGGFEHIYPQEITKNLCGAMLKHDPSAITSPHVWHHPLSRRVFALHRLKARMFRPQVCFAPASHENR